MSFVRSLYHQTKDPWSDRQNNLFLIDGASHPRQLGYRKELARIAADVPWFTYVPTFSRPWEDNPWKGETGRVDDLVCKYTDSWGLTPENTVVYPCGHPAMIENRKGILKRRGWEKEAVKEEVYFIPTRVAAAAS